MKSRKKRDFYGTPITKLQRNWLAAIKLGYMDTRWGKMYITDIFRNLPTATRKKLVKHGLIEAKIEVTPKGEKEIFIKQMGDI